MSRDKDIIDELLEVGACLDWLTPLWKLIQDAISGPAYTFLIPLSGWSGSEISRMLEERGVQSWAPMIVEGQLLLTVKESQAAWAQELLSRAGIATETPYTKSGRQEQEQRQRPGQRQGQKQEQGGGSLSNFADWMERRKIAKLLERQGIQTWRGQKQEQGSGFLSKFADWMER